MEKWVEEEERMADGGGAAADGSFKVDSRDRATACGDHRASSQVEVRCGVVPRLSAVPRQQDLLPASNESATAAVVAAGDVAAGGASLMRLRTFCAKEVRALGRTRRSGSSPSAPMSKGCGNRPQG